MRFIIEQRGIYYSLTFQSNLKRMLLLAYPRWESAANNDGIIIAGIEYTILIRSGDAWYNELFHFF